MEFQLQQSAALVNVEGIGIGGVHVDITVLVDDEDVTAWFGTTDAVARSARNFVGEGTAATIVVNSTSRGPHA
jgi:hypothetical protein